MNHSTIASYITIILLSDIMSSYAAALYFAVGLFILVNVHVSGRYLCMVNLCELILILCSLDTCEIYHPYTMNNNY